MLRPILRSSPSALRRVSSRAAPNSTRFLSTSPAHRPRTWKSSALRWGAAVAAIYWYNTSPIFADEPTLQTIPAPPTFSDDDQRTVDAIIDEKRRKSSKPIQSVLEDTEEPAVATPSVVADATVPADGVAALEEEADQQGAFNPETGEINWDCPCLGGMAHGPCGEEFKTAFSCFVYSNEEPKGMDCIEKFQGMQDCFRQYPEIYGAELTDDGTDDEQTTAEDGAIPSPGPGDESNGSDKTSSPSVDETSTNKAVADEPVEAQNAEKPSEAPQSVQSPPKPTTEATGSD